MSKPIVCAVLLASLSLGYFAIQTSPAGERASPATAPTTAPSGPLASDLIGSYKALKLQTPEPVYVDKQLAMLCRGADLADVKRAQKVTGPHAHSTILIYMNALAADAFPKAKDSYPVGSVIVKEKSPSSYRDKDGKEVTRKDAVGGMIKRAPGYDPKHGDWEYFYAEAGEKLQTGRIDSCRDCHGNAAGKDYVFGQWAASVKKGE